MCRFVTRKMSESYKKKAKHLIFFYILPAVMAIEAVLYGVICLTLFPAPWQAYGCSCNNYPGTHIALTSKSNQTQGKKAPLIWTSSLHHILARFRIWNKRSVMKTDGNLYLHFTFNPHTLRGLVGKATDSAVCFPWLHLNSPDQPSYPSIFHG